MMNKKVFLFNPPVGFYQRSEDRCQTNIEGSNVGALRACNDLGYMAAVLRNHGYIAKIMDYPAELTHGGNSFSADKLTFDDYTKDFKEFMPDIAVMSITTSTLDKDMEAFKIAKQINPNVITIAKGAHFLSCSQKSLELYKYMDYALSGESEFIIGDLIETLDNNIKCDRQPETSSELQDHEMLKQVQNDAKEVKGLFYWNKEKTQIFKTEKAPFRDDLNSLPFPARDLMNNKLYNRPDTGKPMATISVSRGCPSSCTYCLTPTVSGLKVRKRSAINIVDELQECVEKHGITDFFFKADTFTIDKKWTKEVCDEILARDLKIQWGANSRVRPIDAETLQIMRKAGCWLIAFGIESGSSESLEKMKKGATKEEARQAIKWAREAGLKINNYFLIGFPWETKAHVEETIAFAKELDSDYVEFNIILPFEGTELFNQIKDTDLIETSIIGHDSYTNPVMKTHYLSTEELLELKNKALREICLTPHYILKTLRNIKSINEFLRYSEFGIKMIKHVLFK